MFYVFHRTFFAFYFENDSDIVVLTEAVLIIIDLGISG